ncbi:AbrB family transcriptional regulator [Halostagnicola larsenii XH-48]|uniref:AbrB family transcriptional regulator n=1 Tax=Halostagnicola larsenii XH-48 TaxID=797299 RepID=W0JKI9_9EURY|nr:AbrB/MazE/SpoVT family DNA-binding domain-containing protein [Halostagnicola larsenii]AHF99260.1 AbrB family transcriptional regulator [Halostagnicola larsenii XH-48]
MAITQDATITSKGQVTIPKEIREELGIGEGTEVEFVLTDADEVTVRPKKPAMDRLREIQSTLSKHDIDVEKLRRESKDAWGGQTGVLDRSGNESS